MAWVKIDDAYNEHRKLLAVGPIGHAQWLAGLAYCNRNLTDGFIPWAKAETLVCWQFLGPTESDGRQARYTVCVTCGMGGEDVTSEFAISLLLDAGLWERVERGYHIHDYDQYQPSREQVLDDRQAGAARQKAWREAHPEESNTARNARRNSDRNAVTNSGRNVPVTGAPVPDSRFPIPVPESRTDVPDSTKVNVKDTPPRAVAALSVCDPTESDMGAANGAAEPGEPVMFTEFMSIYPKQTDRKEALREWYRVCPNPQEAGRAIVGLKAQLEASMFEVEFRYVPLASTYLKKLRYRDPIPPRNGVSPSGLTLENMQSEIGAELKRIGYVDKQPGAQNHGI